MARLSAMITTADIVGANALTLHRESTILGSSMQPKAVAQSLLVVENEWQQEAQFYADCQARGDQEAIKECRDAPAKFKNSCGMVVSALLQGSSGDKPAVQGYLNAVCSQQVLEGR